MDRPRSLDDSSRAYVDETLRQVDRYSTPPSSSVFGESMMAWRPKDCVDRVAVPLFLAHGVENHLHSPDEADALAQAWSGRLVRHQVDGGHTEWMHDDDPRIIDLSDPYLEQLAAPNGRP